MAAARSSRRYGPKANKKVGRALHEMKRGKLVSGRSKKKVKSRKQAVAIGLSEARRSGAKVPKRKAKATTKRGRKTASSAGRASKTTRKSGAKRQGTKRRKTKATSRSRKSSR